MKTPPLSPATTVTDWTQAEIDAAQAEADKNAEATALDTLNAAGIVFDDGATFLDRELDPPDWIVPNFLARGFKGDLNAKSKMCKSFFVLQLGLCVAAGRDFLQWHIPTPRRVAYFNHELADYFAQDRCRTMADALGIERAELAGRFYLVNLRGRTHLLRDNGAALSAALRKMEIDLAIFDPRYSLLQAGEDENKGDGIRGILDFRNDLITRAGCAVLMVGHDPKGDTAGKPIADRGAGSYWAGADYDFALALSPHETDGAEVLSASSRYRKSPADLTVLFDGETLTFSADPDTPALAKNAKPPTSAKDRADRLAAKQAALEKTVRELVADGTLRTMSEFRLAVAQTEAGAALGENIRRQMLDGFISKGGDWIMTTPQLIKKPNGDVGKVKHGTIIVGSSEAITNYLQQFGSQPT